MEGIRSATLTWAKKVENGSPLSRAKANICRDAVATFVMQPHVVKVMRMAVMAEVPP